MAEKVEKPVGMRGEHGWLAEMLTVAAGGTELAMDAIYEGVASGMG